MSSFSLSSLLLLLLLLLPFLALSSEPGLNDDVLGLIVFKADLQDPSSKLLAWNEDDEAPCRWPGVLCDPKTSLVSELSLSGFSLSGKIGVRGLLRLRSLRKLSLSRNNFSGPLSPEILRLESLRTLDLSENSLSGSIPDGFFSQCRSLRTLSLANNDFSGEIPANVGSCSTLAAMNLSSNQLSGALPSGLWDLNALRMLDLSDNLFSGEVPAGVHRMFNLRSISLRGNRLSGILPEDIGACLLLKSLDLGRNSFSGELPVSMQRLSMCQYLSLSSNSFAIEVPHWLGELRRLQFLDLSDNKFSGEVPDSISELTALKELKLSGNNFTGSLTESMAACKSLSDVDFSRNSFTGGIPSWLFQSTLQRVLISENKLSDSLRIPKMNHSTITVLDLSGNAFSGVIPDEISSIQSLQSLNLSHNAFSGHIHANIGDLRSLELIDFSHNLLNGSIPSEIGKLISLKSLNLSQNNLTGSLPPTLANSMNLQTIDISHNKFSGTLPKQLSDLPHLHSFNISHNLFSGPVPTGHFFDTIPASSLSDNPNLCGSAVHRACPAVLPKPIVLNPNSSSPNNSSHKASPEFLGHKKTILSISTLIAIGAAAVIAIGVIGITVLNLRVRSMAPHSAAALALFDDNVSRSETTEANSGKLVMFSGEPEFSAGAHAVLNKDCELGRGGFGTVYKTTLKDGRPVAIKKLTVSSMVKSQDEFEKVIKKLAKIRHPNLVALEGYYWTSSLQLLIYEFLSGGSLYKHLHENSTSNTLSWRERFNIILGVARSLAHLHQLNIIHYNLKSSNVLIDGTGVPKVGDYGLAKLLPMLDRYVISSKIQSALGYMAPEFACRTVKITEKCDVYAFGVLILEIMTGRRPVEYMEDDVVVLCDVMREAMEEGKADEFVDVKLQGCVPAEEMVPVIKLGLICTSQVPSNRPEMSEVVSILELVSCSQGSSICAEIS
ncbi:Non-specific serine/threonine protein kinase protein [Dioscorea alata]|uniref:Non-specific serine/threonine protein kinase protein n=1 Tax=Dioscorea alata TaxID=55571 RepID=A0ACB7V2W7_DIOAL|nr:Non-specific serine/threonine protein kinase protein [Dioscorea alata]